MRKGKLLIITALSAALLLPGCSLVDFMEGDINGQSDNLKLKSLEVATAPSKTRYLVNEDLDLTGLTLKVTYYNNSTKTISNPTSDNIAKLPNNKKYTATEGKKSVGVVYTENDMTVRSSFQITVSSTPVTQYTITFDKNGGTGSMASETIDEGETYTLPANGFTAPSGKVFKAWQVGSNTTERAPGYSFVVTSDVTVKAIWKDEDQGQGGGGGGSTTDTAAWTIMLYISGNDLESGQNGYGQYNYLATEDITEILSISGQPSDVNIIIQTGGCKKWSPTYSIPTNKVSRYYIEGKKLKQDSTNSSLTNVSMGASSTFQSFLEWGLTNYPAEKTGVILWNHGGALDGVCYDEKHKSNGVEDCLTDDEVVTALSKAFKTVNRTEKLEFIGYDACLMQVQDIAEFNSQYFNYMVGAQESEAGEGWAYDTWIDDLYAKKSTDTILKAICDGFIKAFDDKYGVQGYDNDQTLSYLDLSKIGDYKTAFETLATQIKTKYNASSSNANAFENLVKSVKCYADTYCDEEDYEYYTGEYNYPEEWFESTGDTDYPYVLNGYHLYGSFDVTDFLNKLASNSTYSSLSTYITNAKNALKEVIKYNKKGAQAGNSNGLCMICPMENPGLVDYNASYTHFTNWRSFTVNRL